MQDFDTRYNQPGGGFVSGLLFGAAVGAALGVIFAPRAGSDTRRQIAESGKNLREGALRTYEQAREGANSAVSKARTRVRPRPRGLRSHPQGRREHRQRRRRRGVGRAVGRRVSACVITAGRLRAGRVRSVDDVGDALHATNAGGAWRFR